jgi:membrane-associated protein
MGIGYLLGDAIKGSVNEYLYPAVGIIVLISLLPLIKAIYEERKSKN